MRPSWQGSAFVLEDQRKNSVVLGAYENEKLVRYTFYNPLSKKTYQIDVDKNYRRRGIATGLFEVIRERNNGQPVSCNNVDEVSESTHNFLSQKIGLNNWVSQFENE